MSADGPAPTLGGERALATRAALGSAASSVHPEISWSVVLGAQLWEAVPVEAVAVRVHRAFEPNPSLGPIPEPRLFDLSSNDPSPAFDAVANTSFTADAPLVRILAVEDPPHLVLAAHHAVLDGLGLLALLGVALGGEVSSDVRGLSAERATHRRFSSNAVRRIAEAILAPPSRVAAEGRAPAKGDWLLSRALPGAPPGTSTLAWAVARAIRRWNNARSAPFERIVLAIGASLRPGSNPGLEDRSAYLRLVVTSDEPSVLARSMRSAPLESGEPPAAVRRLLRLARPTARLLAGRLGSTALVSSLGRVDAPPMVRAIDFFPVAHGLSAVSLGMAGVGDQTRLALRCPRRRFSDQEARALLDLIAYEAAISA